MGGAPAGYDAGAYGRDFKRFHAFASAAAPEMLILGPGSVGETAGEPDAGDGDGSTLKTRNLLMASRPAAVDAFSYHHYGALSRRCAATGAQTTPDAALSEEWLRGTDRTLAFYRTLRDVFAPGKPLWLTETADAACAAIHGRARSSTRSATSTSLAASPRRASRSSPTTRWWRATTAFSTTSRWRQNPTTGAR